MKRKFNIVDVVIIVLALAMLGGVILLRNRSTSGSAVASERQTRPMRFTVEFTNAPLNMEKAITLGDDAYSSVTGSYLGTIKDVWTKPHEVLEYSDTLGKYVSYIDEQTCDLYMVIENEGYCTAKEIVVGETAVRVGAEMQTKGKGFARAGYVVAVDTMGEPIPKNTEEQKGESEAEFIIRFTDARDIVLDQIHVGDTLYEHWTGCMLGVVQSVDIKPYGETKLLPDGTAALVEKPERYSIDVTVKGKCVIGQNGYYMDGGVEIKIGGGAWVLSPYLDRSGIFYDLLSIGA